MKPKSIAQRSLLSVFTAITVVVAATDRSSAASIVWDGGGDSANALGIPENWAGEMLPFVVNADTATRDGSVAGALSLQYNTDTFAGGPGNPGVNLETTSDQTSALAIDSGLNTSSMRLNDITLAEGSGAFSRGDHNDIFNITLGGASGQTHIWTSLSSNAAMANSDVRIALGGAGNHALRFNGTGDWRVSAPLAPANASNLCLQKTGTGELTLSGDGSFQGGIAAFGSSSAAFLKEATTRITGGSYTSNNTEFTVGGLDAGPGTNTRLIMDGGSLTGVSWLSVGRGNGDGTAGSDVILNNDASITTADISIGFLAGNAVGPRGSITLNGTSILTATGASFFIAESHLAGMTLTVNDNATVNATAASVIVGRTSGVGKLVMNGGTLDIRQVTSAQKTNTAAFNFNGGTLRITGSTGAINQSGGLTITGGARLVQDNISFMEPPVAHTLGGIDSNADFASIVVANHPANFITPDGGLAEYMVADSLEFQDTAVLNLGADGGFATRYIETGTLNVNHASALGDTAAGLFVIQGGVLDITSGEAIATTTAKAQSWADDFAFAGTNNLTSVSLVIEYGPGLAGFANQVNVPVSSGVVGGVTFTITPSGDEDMITASIPHGGAPKFFARHKAQN